MGAPLQANNGRAAVVGMGLCALATVATQRALLTLCMQGPAPVLAAWGVLLTYAAALIMWALLTLRLQHAHGVQSRALLIGVALMHVAVACVPPTLSIDVASYLAHGFLGAHPPWHPYVQAARDVDGTPYGAALRATGWEASHGISPYGPLWTLWETAVVKISEQVWVGMLAMKAMVLGGVALSAWAVHRILGQLQPARQTVGVLVFLTNPCVVLDLSHDGHNDAVMLAAVLWALDASLRRRWLASALALSVGVFTKYLPALFAWPLVCTWWRARPLAWRALAVAVLSSAGLGVAAFAPVWVGLNTFAGVRAQSALAYMAGHVPLLWWELRGAVPDPWAAWAVLGVSRALFAWQLWRAGVATLGGDAMAGWARIATMYVLIITPTFWPWYWVLPVALWGVLGTPRAWHYSLLLSVCARVVEPLDVMMRGHLLSYDAMVLWATALGVTLPAVAYFIVRPLPASSTSAPRSA